MNKPKLSITEYILYYADVGLIGIFIGSIFSVIINLYTSIDTSYIWAIISFLLAICCLVFYMNSRDKISRFANIESNMGRYDAFAKALDDSRLNRPKLYLSLIVSLIFVVSGIVLINIQKTDLKKNIGTLQNQLTGKLKSIENKSLTINNQVSTVNDIQNLLLNDLLIVNDKLDRLMTAYDKLQKKNETTTSEKKQIIENSSN